MILILDFVTSTLTLHNSCTGVKNWGNDAKKKHIFVIDNEASKTTCRIDGAAAADSSDGADGLPGPAPHKQ